MREQQTSTEVLTTDILGVGVSAINMDDAIALIDRWVEERTPNYVCVTGVHGVMESRSDPRLFDIHNRAGLVCPDGMPLVWMSYWRGAKGVERVYGPDLMRAISTRSSARGYRHFYFGGAPGVADKLAASLVAAYPGLQVAGTLLPSVPRLDAGRGRRSRRTNQRRGARYRLGRPKHPQAGKVDGQPRRKDQCTGLDRRGSGIRFSRGN